MDYVLIHSICLNFVKECEKQAARESKHPKAFERAAAVRLVELEALAEEQGKARAGERRHG